MPKKLSAIARARKIKLLLFDVDGVLTDGKLFIFPGPSGSQQSILEQSAKHGGKGGFGLNSQSLIEAKGFHAHDGISISLARLAGIKTGLITKRISETVALRARDLKLEHVHQGVQDKRTCFEDILKQEGLKPEEAAFVGDDVIDLPAMRAGGLSIAVKNARAEVKAEAHYITPHAGGEGALRDAVEFILKAQGKWKRVVEEYIGERSPKDSRQLSAIGHRPKPKPR
jgi:3-deoxy-D-manno-octulosonate 8-phosphate phosphatase (KDO 8-P phosphatase)